MNAERCYTAAERLTGILETTKDERSLELLGNLLSAIRLVKATELPRAWYWKFQQLQSRVERRIAQLGR